MVFHDDCGCARDYNHKHFEKDDDDSKEYDYVENDDDGCVIGECSRNCLNENWMNHVFKAKLTDKD